VSEGKGIGDERKENEAIIQRHLKMSAVQCPAARTQSIAAKPRRGMTIAVPMAMERLAEASSLGSASSPDPVVVVGFGEVWEEPESPPSSPPPVPFKRIALR